MFLLGFPYGRYSLVPLYLTQFHVSIHTLTRRTRPAVLRDIKLLGEGSPACFTLQGRITYYIIRIRNFRSKEFSIKIYCQVFHNISLILQHSSLRPPLRIQKIRRKLQLVRRVDNYSITCARNKCIRDRDRIQHNSTPAPVK